MGTRLHRPQPHQTHSPRLTARPRLKPLSSHRYLDGLLARGAANVVPNTSDLLITEPDEIGADRALTWVLDTDLM